MCYFSVVIPTYNRAHLISETIHSVIQQVFKDWECIIIDDGSNDDTREIVEKITREEPRIKYIYQENAERGAARNNGIANAKGKYICFLDSDDHFIENHLQVIYDEINKDKNAAKALFFTNSYNLSNEGYLSERTCPRLCDYELFQYILTYTFNPARVAVHKDILEDFNFNPKIPGLEDLDLWLRIATKYPVIQINQRTAIYNLHEDTYTLGFKNRFKRELSFFKIIFNQPILKSKLPKKATAKLISMCHYHIAIAASEATNRKEFYRHAYKSVITYPKGYNGRTNFPLFVQSIYMLPILGDLLKLISRKVKTK